MKKNIYLFIIVSLMISCSTQPHYVIKGKIAGSDSITFYLQKRAEGKNVTIDSAVSKKGSFTMKGGAIDYPQLVQLIAGNSRKRAAFYLENSEIFITGSMDSLFKADIKGSKTQDEFKAFVESNKPLSEAYSKTYLSYQVASKTGKVQQMAILEKQADSIDNEITRFQAKFVKNNPSSYVAASILGTLSPVLQSEELDSLINGLDSAIKAIPSVKSLEERVAAMRAVGVGKKAPDFTMNDVEGKPVTLYSKVGPKLLLVDFWASWCRPCRQENPNVVKVYTKYHKKGFDVLGVSLDRKKEDWVKAIADDKLAWNHVSDLKYWENAVARQYAVYSIPSNFLLDENGTIIGRNLTGEDLYNKVKEVLDKK